MTTAASTSAARSRKPRSSALGIETEQITLRVPKDLIEQFREICLKEYIPLDIYLVRELAGLNRQTGERAGGES
jgi:hypothetical protein